MRYAPWPPRRIESSQAKPSRAKPSRAKPRHATPSQAKSSQAKPSQVVSAYDAVRSLAAEAHGGVVVGDDVAQYDEGRSQHLDYIHAEGEGK
jgi:hypothetical protein